MKYGKKIQIGNYTFLKIKREYNLNGTKVRLAVIRVQTISGHWAMEYREDMPFFMLVEAGVDDESMNKGLGYIMSNAYIMGQIVPDTEFLNALNKCIEEFASRRAEKGEQPTKEEDDKIIEELKENVL